MLKVNDEKKAEATVKKTDAAVSAKAEAAATAQTPQVSEEIIGSKSNTIAFVAPLGDPSKPDQVTNEKTGVVTRTSTIVGYRFKALEDMDVPDCGLTINFKKDAMDFADPNGVKHVKKGEIFDLTPFETGLLLAAPEYNAYATGGEKAVVCAYSRKSLVDGSGAVARVDSEKVPRISLRAVGGGSIKDFKIIDVLTFTVEKNGDGPERKIRKIVKGFEKWEVLCMATQRQRSASAGEPKATYNEGAAAFMKIAQKKKAKAAAK